MRLNLAVAAALCAAGALLGGASSAYARPPRPQDVPGWASFVGAPPPFRVPSGGTARLEAIERGYRLTLRRADGGLFAQADSTGERFDELTYFSGDHPYVTIASLAAGGAPPLAPAASCGSAFNAPLNYQWRTPQRWWLVSGSVPPYVSSTLTEQSLVNAHLEWESNDNHCGIGDASLLAFAYQGRIGTNLGLNGYSTIGWGEVDQLGGVCVGAIACTLTWYGSDGSATESDARMDVNPVPVCPGTTWSWVNGDTNCRYDIWAVYAHELGHTAGFGHVGDRSLVMNPIVYTHDVSNRRLGKGDALGNNDKY